MGGGCMGMALEPWSGIAADPDTIHGRGPSELIYSAGIYHLLIFFWAGWSFNTFTIDPFMSQVYGKSYYNRRREKKTLLGIEVQDNIIKYLKSSRFLYETGDYKDN